MAGVADALRHTLHVAQQDVLRDLRGVATQKFPGEFEGGIPRAVRGSIDFGARATALAVVGGPGEPQ